MDSLSADNPPLGYTRDEIVLIKTYLTEYSLLEPKARIAFSKKKVIASAKGRELWRRLVQQISNKIGIPALIAKSMEESDVNPFWQQAQTGTWPTARQCVGKYSDRVARNLLGNEAVPGNMIRGDIYNSIAGIVQVHYSNLGRQSERFKAKVDTMELEATKALEGL